MSAHPTLRAAKIVTNALYVVALGVVILYGEPAADAAHGVVRQVVADLNPPADNWKFIEQQELRAARARQACPNSEVRWAGEEPVCVPRRGGK